MNFCAVYSVNANEQESQMTELTVQSKDSTEIRQDEQSSSIVEWQIQSVSTPEDDATLDGCACGCGCGCGCV